MKPGRELDALVAEKVMGWKWNGFSAWHPCGSKYARIPQGGRELPVTVDPMETWLPFYSTYIGSAWDVAQKIKDMDEDHEFVIYLSDSKFNECTVEVKFWQKDDFSGETILAGPYYILGDTAPHAICLAALKAVGK